MSRPPRKRVCGPPGRRGQTREDAGDPRDEGARSGRCGGRRGVRRRGGGLRRRRRGPRRGPGLRRAGAQRHDRHRGGRGPERLRHAGGDVSWRRHRHRGQPRLHGPHRHVGRRGPPTGQPLFDVRVPAGTSATVPGVEALSAGAWAFYCKFHPNMRGTITVEGGAAAWSPSHAFEQPLVVPAPSAGADIRLVMRRAEVRSLPHGPRTSMWTYDGSYPGPTIRRRGGQRHRGDGRQPAAPAAPAPCRRTCTATTTPPATTASRRRT